MPWTYIDKAIVVTGATGNVGRRLMAQCCAAGGKVIAVDLNERRRKDLKIEFPDVTILILDTARRSPVAETIHAANGKIDILCNNAALIEAAVIEYFEEHVWDEIIRVNLTGIFWYCVRWFL